MFLSTRRNQRIARFNRPQRKVDDKFSSEPQGKSRLNTTEQTYQHIYLWKFKQNQVRFVTWKMHKIFILIDDGFCLHYFGNCTTQFLGMSSIISTHCHNLCAHLHQFVPQKSRHPSCDSPKLKIARHCSEPRNPQSLHRLLLGPNWWAYDRLLDPSNFRRGWFHLLFSWRNLYFWTFNAVWIGENLHPDPI